MLPHERTLPEGEVGPARAPAGRRASNLDPIWGLTAGTGLAAIADQRGPHPSRGAADRRPRPRGGRGPRGHRAPARRAAGVIAFEGISVGFGATGGPAQSLPGTWSRKARFASWFGPSGCKSTLLRMINRLIEPTAGPS